MAETRRLVPLGHAMARKWVFAAINLALTPRAEVIWVLVFI